MRTAEVLKQTITGLIPIKLRRGRDLSDVLSKKPGHKVAKDKDSAQIHVRLLEPVQRLPITPVERLAIRRLKGTGSMPFNQLVALVAKDLYHEELRAGAGVLDIGLFGSGLFTRDVTRDLKAGDGILWKIKQEKGNV